MSGEYHLIKLYNNKTLDNYKLFVNKGAILYRHEKRKMKKRKPKNEKNIDI